MSFIDLSQAGQLYKIDLPIFEGPLDLLLHLVRKNEIEIGDLPISILLDQYLEYLNSMEVLNIDLSGEFIFMASELAYIKSKLLLPHEESSDEELLGDDPRQELINRLLDYQRYKEVAQKLDANPQLARDVFTNAFSAEDSNREANIEADLFKMVTCFSQVLARAPKNLAHEVMQAELSITDKIYHLVEKFESMAQGDPIDFVSLFDEDSSRSEVIITFLSLLEMCKLKWIQVYQSGSLYVSWIKKTEEDLEVAEITFH